jgi:hypothetical protein
MSLPPKIFTWTGKEDSVLFWDDPSNWEDGEYPNQKEAVVVFSNSVNRDTTIILRKNIHLGQMWFNEQHQITIESAKAADLEGEESPALYLETANQFSTIFIDRENRGDHRIPVFFHSCYFGQTHRDLALGRPVPEGVHITTIHLDGEIGNYKDPERASLQVYGRLRFQLNQPNSFKGPVVAKDHGEIRAMVNGAIPDKTPIYLNDRGQLFIDDGVLVNAGELHVDGKKLEAAVYVGVSEDKKWSASALDGLSARDRNKALDLKVFPLESLRGRGAVIAGL